MSKTLTAKQKKRYLKNPVACPYCESTDLTAGDTYHEDVRITQSIECIGCGETWEDIYTVTDVKADGEPS